MKKKMLQHQLTNVVISNPHNVWDWCAIVLLFSSKAKSASTKMCTQGKIESLCLYLLCDYSIPFVFGTNQYTSDTFDLVLNHLIWACNDKHAHLILVAENQKKLALNYRQEIIVKYLKTLKLWSYKQSDIELKTLNLKLISLIVPAGGSLICK